MCSYNDSRNLKVIISYNGAAYHGFQIQSNAETIQGVIERALSKLLGESVCINGCSRTDSGVHAREFCFNVRINCTIPCDGFVRGLNSLLPRDIAVHSAIEVADDFHARFSAKAKEYVYVIHNAPIRDVFMTDLAYFYPKQINLNLMEKAAELFIGEHDFSAYCKAESLQTVLSKQHGAIREIYDCHVVDLKQSGRIEIMIRGNGFLHNMVRIIAGTLVYVGDGKLTLDDVRVSLSGGNRDTAGITLPACGLYLNRVIYDTV